MPMTHLRQPACDGHSVAATWTVSLWLAGRHQEQEVMMLQLSATVFCAPMASKALRANLSLCLLPGVCDPAQPERTCPQAPDSASNTVYKALRRISQTSGMSATRLSVRQPDLRGAIFGGGVIGGPAEAQTSTPKASVHRHARFNRQPVHQVLLSVLPRYRIDNGTGRHSSRSNPSGAACSNRYPG
jgi:hypothetical protein